MTPQASAPNSNQSRTASLDPREEPALLLDKEGQPKKGLYVENIQIQNEELVIRGWSFGNVEFEFESEGTAVSCELGNSTRSDVEATFSLEAGSGSGFLARIKAFDHESAYTLKWRFDSDEHFHGTVIRTPESNSDSGGAAPLMTDGSGLFVDYISGSEVVGWSVHGKEPASVEVSLGGCSLGRINPTIARADVQAHLEAEDPILGFHIQLGGVMQFAGLSHGCKEINLAQSFGSSLKRPLLLEEFRDQLPDFAPLLNAYRDLPATVGAIRNVRTIDLNECALLVESAKIDSSDESLVIDFYQETQPGELERVDRDILQRNGQCTPVQVCLHSIDSPLLIVIANEEGIILTTDVVPLLSLYLPENALLIEYHSVFSGYRNRDETAARLGQNYLAARVRPIGEANSPAPGFPRRETTAVVLFDRQAIDPDPKVDFERSRSLFDRALSLDRDGKVILDTGEKTDWETLLNQNELTHFVFLDRSATLRPDYWEVLDEMASLWNKGTTVAYGDSLVVPDLERAYVVKHSLLNHEVFRRHRPSGIKSMIVHKTALKKSFKSSPQDFRAGLLRPDHAFAGFGEKEILHLPIVLDQSFAEPETKAPKKFFASHQQSLAISPGPSPGLEQSGGISVILSHLNSPEQTVECLDTLYLQEFSGDLEVILVTNGNPKFSDPAIRHAEKLFGKGSVRRVSCDGVRRGSDQYDLGAKAARYEYLLFLSSDVLLVTPTILSEAREVAAVSWIGTCGFRIIGKGDFKGLRLHSLGLTGSIKPSWFVGGSPLTGNQVPYFLQDSTLEVAGNNFAAVCVRKKAYRDIRGRGSETYSKNVHEADFCLRAASKGLRHVAIGSCIIEQACSGSESENDWLTLTESSPHVSQAALGKLNRFGVLQL